jgi:DNA-binding transcriptional LysR family regulator
MQSMEWSDLRYVLAIARAGTLSAAARRLGVNQTTVSRRLAAAETSLRARLFDRAEGMFHPTKACDEILRRAAQIEAEIDAIERGVSGSDAVVAGSVRVTAVPILVNRLLIPALPQLYTAHPRLQVELSAEPRNLRLTRREAEIALRLARPESGDALARRIGQLDYAVYAPARKSGDPPWITYDDSLSHLPQARWIAAATKGAPPKLLVNDAEAILQAVGAGLGQSLLPCFAADDDKRLRRVSGAKPVLSREIWLLVHRELRAQARIAAVIDWLDGAMPAAARPQHRSIS